MYRKPSTIENYTDALRLHLLPELGHVPISEITRDDMNRFARTLENKRRPNGEIYSIASVQGFWRIAKMILKDADADNFIDIDPTYRVRPPEAQREHVDVGPKREQSTLELYEINAILNACQELYPQRYAEVAVLAWTGMRPGEMYALEWSDIDFDDREISITKAVWNGNVGRPKTVHGRIVPINDLLMDVLDAHQSPGDVVFPSDLGTYRVQSSLKHVWRALELNTDVGIRLGCQVLRRSFNTMLRSNGTHDNVIRAIMGHSSPKMTMRYDGVSIDDKLAAVYQPCVPPQTDETVQ